MAELTLRDRRVLIVEDEYLLADELRGELETAGAIVLGPVGNIEDAFAIIAEAHIDGAILDVNLRGEMTFEAADVLVKRGVPFVFTTGYDASVIPIRFRHVPRCEKPVSMAQISRDIERMIHA